MSNNIKSWMNPQGNAPKGYVKVRTADWERFIRAKSEQRIKEGNWFHVIVPLDIPDGLALIPVSIERTIVDKMADAIGDVLKAAESLARSATNLLPTLQTVGTIAQQEVFNKTPIVTTLHYVLFDGALYVSEAEFFPYV